MNLTIKLAHIQLANSKARVFWSVWCMALSTAVVLVVFFFYAAISSALHTAIGEATYIDALTTLQKMNVAANGFFAVVCLAVVAFSVLVLFALFRAGASERMWQFNTLRSAGMSMSQLRCVVMNEAAILILPGLLAGIVLGKIFVHFALQYLPYFAQLFVYAIGINLSIVPSSYWEVVLVTSVVSIAVSLFSAWLAAWQIARMAESRAFGVPDISVYRKRNIAYLEQLVRELFGIKGVLAYRYTVRSLVDFRMVMFPLVVSVVLMVGVLSLGMQIQAFEAAHGVRQAFVFVVYGFAGLLLLLAMSNAINNMYANARVFSRDITIANSVGIDAKGLRQVRTLGIPFSSVLALIKGLPLGIAVSWLGYRVLPDSMGLTYVFPWWPIAYSILGIAIMTCVAMYFSARNLSKSSYSEVAHFYD